MGTDDEGMSCNVQYLANYYVLFLAHLHPH